MNKNINININDNSPGKLAEELSKGKWKLHEHLKYINDIVTNNIIVGNQKILINMPPRHGKSAFLCEWLPLWFLYKYNDKQIMLATYNQRLANHWGRKVKDLVKEYAQQTKLEIRKDTHAANNFLLTTGGGMTCIGANGTLTGKGADLLLIDDPIKNDAEANSITYRDALWNWFNSTAFTRIEPNGTIIIIMTRWHEDDLCGRLIKYNDFLNKNDNNTTEWKQVKIPAIATENDILNRQQGEALWKERYNIKKLNEIKMQIGEYWFAALYQQQPNAATGNIFKRNTFKYFFYDKEKKCFFLDVIDNNETNIKKKNNSNQTKNMNSIFDCNSNKTLTKEYIHFDNIISIDDCKILAVVDLAVTAKETSDYTVILVFALTQKQQILILDVIRVKFEGSEHLDLLCEVYNLWKPALIGIESVQYQMSLIQMAMKKNLPIKPLRPDKDKISRCLPVITMLEAGNVYFHKNNFINNDSDWLTKFEEELLAFPNGKYDDQVDALGYVTYMIAPITDNNRNYKLIVSGKKRNYLEEF